MTGYRYCPGCPHRTERHDDFGCRYRACNCDLTAKAIRQITGGAPCRCSTARPVPDIRLPPQMAAVLTLMATGRTNQQIADRLHVDVATIKSHARRIFRTLGAAGREHAVAIGYDRGLLKPGASRGGVR